MRVGRGGRSRSMHDGEVFLLPERLKRRHCRVESEEAVEIEQGFFRNVDCGPHRVVCRLTVRYDDVEPVSRTALEDDDQAPGANSGIGCAVGRARQETWERRCAYYGQGAIAKKDATGNRHMNQPSAICHQLFPS